MSSISETGRTSRCRSLGVATDWPHRRLALIPADTVARIVLALTGQGAAIGGTFRVQSPHKKTHGELARTLNKLSYFVRLVVLERFAETVVALGAHAALAEDGGRMLPMLEALAGRCGSTTPAPTVGSTGSV